MCMQITGQNERNENAMRIGLIRLPHTQAKACLPRNCVRLNTGGAATLSSTLHAGNSMFADYFSGGRTLVQN